MLIGILVCLASAVIQTLSFVSSRRFIVAGHGNPFRLLAMGHVLMGLLAAVVFPFFWHALLLDIHRWLWLTLAASAFYLFGQVFFMIALRRSDSSRVAPLLALKMPAVAVVTILVLRDVINMWQWLAVGIAVAAAFVLNRIGGTLPKQTVLSILLAVCSFAMCDVVIVALIDACMEDAAGATRFAAATRAVCVTYMLCGLGAALLLPWLGARKRRAWLYAAPYACAWLPSMYLFYMALSLIGPVLGNIVISTRGLWAIVLGALIAKAG
ncbi:MAG: DMT family transporter, partial [Pirellulales bacterium]